MLLQTYNSQFEVGGERLLQTYNSHSEVGVRGYYKPITAILRLG